MVINRQKAFRLSTAPSSDVIVSRAFNTQAAAAQVRLAEEIMIGGGTRKRRPTQCKETFHIRRSTFILKREKQKPKQCQRNRQTA